MKIVSYKSFGPIKFGMTEDEVIKELGKPNNICTDDDGEFTYSYHDFGAIWFDASKLVSGADIYPKEHGLLQINDLQLNWQDNFYIDMCLEDADPYYEFTTIVLFNLGIAIAGYQDNEDADRCIGVFSEKNYDSLMKGTIPLKISRIKNLNKRKLYVSNIFSYLAELNPIAHKDVQPTALTSIEVAAEIRVAMGDLNKLAIKKFEIVSSERDSHRFGDYIKNLFAANNNQIYIWSSQTEACGTYKFDSLKDIHFSSGFYIHDNVDHTIWEFISVDFQDKLLFDFYIDDFTGNEMLEVRVQGLNWPSVKY